MYVYSAHWLFSCINILFVTAQDLTCYSAYSCDSQIHSVAEDIYCYGYYSCKNATIGTNSTSNNFNFIKISSTVAHLYCDRFRSCLNATIYGQKNFIFGVLGQVLEQVFIPRQKHKLLNPLVFILDMVQQFIAKQVQLVLSG